MPDDIFADPRWARLYDVIDGARDDLDLYESIVDEFNVRSVIDLGCGTGSLAVRLAARDVDVVGVDPASASLDIARAKPEADRVKWVLGDARSMADLLPRFRDRGSEAVLMTGNVAMVFVDDDDWHAVLRAAHGALTSDGVLVFEVRDPARRAWEEWAAGSRFARFNTSDGVIETWTEVRRVSLPLVSFRNMVRFVETGELLTSDSVLRFRERAEIERSLADHGFALIDVRDAPDRPGREFVFVARRIAPAQVPGQQATRCVGRR